MPGLDKKKVVKELLKQVHAQASGKLAKLKEKIPEKTSTNTSGFRGR